MTVCRQLVMTDKLVLAATLVTGIKGVVNKRRKKVDLEIYYDFYISHRYRDSMLEIYVF